MSVSILNSTKKALGVGADYDVFDPDIIMHINTVLSTLTQLGFGPTAGFMIEDEYSTWEHLLGSDPRLSAVKSYVYLKVRLSFDPPPTSFHVTALQEQIKEIEWRLSVFRDEIAVETPVEVVALPTVPTVVAPVVEPTPSVQPQTPVEEGSLSVDVDGGGAEG